MSENTKLPFADLTGKRAIVTGASSGIGRAIALELARGGCDVIVHYGHSQSDAEETVHAIQELGQKALAYRADLHHVPAERIVGDAWSAWNGLEIWVNNAGADLLTGAKAELGFSEKLAALWQVDVMGTMLLSRGVLPHMRQAGRGVILNIGWDQADRGMDGDSAQLFSAAKNAVMGFTRSLAVSAAPEVRVNCIAPGWIQTAWGEQASAPWQERVLKETPLGRWGRPEDIANLARFLASDEADYITGQVINANGGAVR